jgi:hypothetical protein
MRFLAKMYLTNSNKKHPHVAKFSVHPQIFIILEQTEGKEGFETTEEKITAYNSPAGRFIDDECSGEKVKLMQCGRPQQQT